MSLVFCPQCGLLLPAGSTACPRCGRPAPAPVPAVPHAAVHAAPHYTRAPGSDLRLGDYLGPLLLFCIPLAGLLAAMIWACGGTASAHRRKLAQAYLIQQVIFWGVVLALAVFYMLGLYIQLLQFWAF